MSRIDIPTLIFCGDVEIREKKKKKIQHRIYRQ